MNNSRLLTTYLPRTLRRFCSEVPQGKQSSSGASATEVPVDKLDIDANVPGLSSAVILPLTQPVGPGVDHKKTGAYKVPEYFCYNNESYYEAEVEMAKYRLPQPSSLKN